MSKQETEIKNGVIYEIRTLNNMMMRRAEASARIIGYEDCTLMHRLILTYLYHKKDEPVYQKDLERVFSVNKSTMTAILKVMEKNQYICRVPEKRDARLKCLCLLPKAIALKDKLADEVIGQTERQLSNGLTEEEIENFIAVVRKMKHNLE